MEKKKLYFTGHDGSRLTAILTTPGSEPRAYALFAHCFTCTKNIKAATNISKALGDKGYAVLRFDFTGLGESEGDFADTNFSSNIEDLIAAASFLEEEFIAPRLLIGHSLGGAAVLQAASRVPSSKAVVTIGAPRDPAHVQQLFTVVVETIKEKGEAEVQLGPSKFTVKKQFLDDLAAVRMKDTIAELRRALLIMHSPVDTTVGIENAAGIFTVAKHPKSFVSLDDADHLLMNSLDSVYAGNIIAAWAERYLD